MSSEGSPPRPSRRIRRVLVESSSGSDSDESVGTARTRKKRLRVVSDEDASDSSGSSILGAGARRRRLPRVRDSGDSDTSGSASPTRDPAPAPVRPASGFSSDSSEGNSDKCSICLMRFTDQQVGTPQTCEHIFCLDCITEWSKNVNTCPVDRIMFDAIVVRSCVGGRVLKTEPVKVTERRSSVDLLVIEDPTVCEICGSTDSEETMLLCDGCDLGFHMACLTPPLDQIPVDQWYCGECAGDTREEDFIYLSEVNDLLLDIEDIERPMGPRVHPLRQPRAARRSPRAPHTPGEPSTSRGRTGEDTPSTSRRAPAPRPAAAAPRRAATTRARRKYKRRRTKTVVIEYEVQGDGKFPVTKRIKRRIKKRKSRARPRTAARRTHVRQSVRAQLAALRGGAGDALVQAAGASAGVQALSLLRHRAGVPALSLFGSRHELDYFSGEEDASESAAAAVVARRPAHAHAFSAYRQARRKMVSIPSPPCASAAPDILSSIMDSQTLLHSKRSIVSVGVDGHVNIKLRTAPAPAPAPAAAPAPTPAPASAPAPARTDKLDLTKGEDSTRKAPSYPGQSRGHGGGWGGGYRGNYHREQGSTFNRGSYEAGNYRGGHQGYGPRPHAGGEGNGFNNAWRPDQEYDEFPRRPRLYPEEDDERTRQNYPPRGRRSVSAAWPPARPDPPRLPPQRHSFGGFEDALDMRTGAGDEETPVRPLPEPPVFKFRSTDVDEEEAGLVIDTDKYDPTEPTRDEDSGDEAARGAPPPLPPAPSPPPALSHILAGLDTSAISVPAGVLDSAVRQVLQEHRGLVAPPPPAGDSDDDDGDCPNFSIYSATSVHIANTSNSGNTPHAAASPPPPPDPHDQELVQRGGDTPDPPPLPLLTAEQEQFKEKISKRCPITPTTRDPIKIKLNTPSLIKRVTLYDEDEEPVLEPEDEAPCDEVPEPEPPCDEAPEPEADAPSGPDDTTHAYEPTEDDALEQSVEDEESNPAGDVQDEGPANMNDKDLDEMDEDVEQKDDATVEPDESRDQEERRDDAGTPELDAAHAPSGDDETDAEGSERDKDDVTEHELDLHSPSSKKELAEKMTESISETEDERSYTPCLDENKSKDTSLETERGGDTGGIEGLDTELISEEEGNEMFSDTEGAGVGPEPGKEREEGEILDKTLLKDDADDAKKKKKKDSKKDGKDKSKSKKKVDVAFKKLSKSGKERNYRDKDDKKKKSRSDSEDKSDKEKERNKREKRKDLERYDVRTVVTGKRARVTDAFGRDVSVSRSPSAPPAHSPPLDWPRRRSPSRPRRSLSKGRRSLSRPRRSLSRGRRSPSRARKSLSPALSPPLRRSMSPRRRSPLKKRRKSLSPRRRSLSRVRKVRSRSVSPRRRRSLSRGRKRRRSPSRSPKPKPTKKKKRSRSERRSHSRPKDLDKEKKKRGRKRSRSARRKSPKQKKNKKRSPPLELSPPPAWSPPPPRAWSRSVDSRLLSPRTPPPDLSPDPRHLRVILANEDKQKRKKEKKRQREAEKRHRRAKDATGPSKEVFTSGNNILVSVSFDKEGEESGARRRRRGEKRLRRERRRQQGPEPEGPKPVAIIDLERSPFRELTPSPKNVIVLSDSEPGDKEPAPAPAAPPAPPPPPAPAALTGPKTPPEPAVKFSIPSKPVPQLRANPLGDEEEPQEDRGPNTPPSPPASPASSPDAYDPFEPTRSPSPPAAAAPPPEPASMTLEAAQRTNLSADEVLAQRPLTPSEKVMALLQSTRDVEVEAPPSGDAASAAENQAESAAAPAPSAAAPAPPTRPALAVASSQRVVLPSPTKGSPLKSQPPKLFLAKPSPIKSTPIKPMQSTKISKLPLPHVKPVTGARKPRYSDVIDLELGDSPYSPGSSDFGDLFEPPSRGGKGHDIFDTLLGGKKSKRDKNSTKVPVKQMKKKGNKLQVGVKLDENKLRILDELPSSAVELQVKSKFLKKLNRQERVVEEVKLVLKPHYNKKHLTKDEYKDVLRRAVPKICHNKSGEINPAKIQALVEAYVKKIRKRRKLGLA